jgi:hypothetical protein
VLLHVASPLWCQLSHLERTGWGVLHYMTYGLLKPGKVSAASHHRHEVTFSRSTAMQSTRKMSLKTGSLFPPLSFCPASPGHRGRLAFALLSVRPHQPQVSSLSGRQVCFQLQANRARMAAGAMPLLVLLGCEMCSLSAVAQARAGREAYVPSALPH